MKHLQSKPNISVLPGPLRPCYWFLLLVCVLLSCATTKQPAPNKYAHLKLHHILQDHNYCLPSCGAMVFDYYGETLTQYQVKDLSSDKEGMFTGTTFPDVIHAAKTLGYNWRLVRFDPDSMGLSKGMQVLKHELDRGRPIVIGVTESEAPNATFTYQDPRSSYIDLPIDHHININHAVVVTGYDEGAQEMTLMDPARPGTGVRVMSYDRFEYLWHEETTRMRFAVLTGPD